MPPLHSPHSLYSGLPILGKGDGLRRNMGSPEVSSAFAVASLTRSSPHRIKQRQRKQKQRTKAANKQTNTIVVSFKGTPGCIPFLIPYLSRQLLPLASTGGLGQDGLPWALWTARADSNHANPRGALGPPRKGPRAGFFARGGYLFWLGF